MDTEWVIKVLDGWITDAGRTRQSAAYSSGLSPWALRFSPEMDTLREREDQTARVVQAALGLQARPTLLVVAGDDEVEVQTGIDLAAQARGRVLTDAETATRLGSTAPKMSADALHPLIWAAASKHWDVDHYSAAVQRAATMLNAEVQDRVGRHDVSDSILMQQTFSTDAPKEDRPRLRWPGDDSDLTVKAMRQGILSMSQGVFSAIRNPATHSTSDMERQEALEQLATLSILARWIDRCVLLAI